LANLKKINLTKEHKESRMRKNISIQQKIQKMKPIILALGNNKHNRILETNYLKLQ